MNPTHSQQQNGFRISSFSSSPNSFSPSGLLCFEEAACINGHVNDDPHDLNSCCALAEEENEYVENLIETEPKFGLKSQSSYDDSSATSKRWIRWARLDAIRWILKAQALFGFHSRTAFLSVIYFDRFNSIRSIDCGKFWAIRLLSMACLSLAAKMEECRPPALSDYPGEEYDFETKIIQKMELLVLRTSDWKMASITPFVYFHYFIAKFSDESKPKELLSRAVELLMAVIKEINLMDHRASTIAAAAVLAAFNAKLTKDEVEMKISFIPSWGRIDIEHILYCYNLMRRIEVAKISTPRTVISPNISSTSSSPRVGTKRRLVFSDGSS